jgi:hypothetical protein
MRLSHKLRPRFSLRTLLVLTALVAAGCYWWIVRPTIVATRFARAIHAKEYTAADALYTGEDRQYVSRRVQWILSGRDSVHLELFVFPRNWTDVFHGQRRMCLSIISYSGSKEVFDAARKNKLKEAGWAGPGGDLPGTQLIATPFTVRHPTATEWFWTNGI